jgi:hypothetical protein
MFLNWIDNLDKNCKYILLPKWQLSSKSSSSKKPCQIRVLPQSRLWTEDSYSGLQSSHIREGCSLYMQDYIEVVLDKVWWKIDLMIHNNDVSPTL